MDLTNVRCAHLSNRYDIPEFSLHNSLHQLRRFHATPILHGKSQIVIRLQPVPELGRNFERLGQQQRHSGRHGAALFAYFIDDTGFNADTPRQFALRNPQWSQELLQKNFSWMRGHTVFGKHGRAFLFSGNRQSSPDRPSPASTGTRSAIDH